MQYYKKISSQLYDHLCDKKMSVDGIWDILFLVFCIIFDQKLLPHNGKGKTTLEFQYYHEQLP